MTRFGAAVEKIDERIPGVDLPLMSVSQTRGVLRRSELTDAPQRAVSLDAYKVCRRNDIVFNKMSIRAGAMGVAQEDGLVTYHYEVMRPRPGNDPRFLTYLMKSSWFTEELIQRERGIGAGDQANVRTTEVPYSVLRTIDAYIPDLTEQRALADYLDRETAHVDTLIAEQQRLIEMLQERRAATVADAFEGLPNARLRYAIEFAQTGPFGTQLSSEDYIQGGIPVINPSHVKRGGFEPDYAVGVTEAKAKELARHRFCVGDIVLGRKGEVDKSALVTATESGWVCGSDSMLLRPAQGTLPTYLWWFLQSPESHSQLEQWSVGSTIAGLNQTTIAKIVLPLPSLEQQRRIVNALNDRIVQIDALIAESARLIELARERRSALITAAVTGEIGVGTRLSNG